jgi:hypothetical protein
VCTAIRWGEGYGIEGAVTVCMVIQVLESADPGEQLFTAHRGRCWACLSTIETVTENGVPERGGVRLCRGPS